MSTFQEDSTAFLGGGSKSLPKAPSFQEDAKQFLTTSVKSKSAVAPSTSIKPPTSISMPTNTNLGVGNNSQNSSTIPSKTPEIIPGGLKGIKDRFSKVKPQDFVLGAGNDTVSNLFRQYLSDTVKAGTDTFKAFANLAPLYTKMLNPLEAGNNPPTAEEVKQAKENIKTGIGKGLETLYRASPEAPIIGASSGVIKASRQSATDIKNGNSMTPQQTLSRAVNEAFTGVKELPFIGEAVTDNPVAQTIINTAFMATMIAKPFLDVGLNELKFKGKGVKLKADQIATVAETLGVKPDAPMAEIAKAYKNKVIEYKDVFAGRGTPEQIAAATKLNDSYNLLKQTGVFEKKLAGLFGKVNVDDLHSTVSKAATEVTSPISPQIDSGVIPPREKALPEKISPKTPEESKVTSPEATGKTINVKDVSKEVNKPVEITNKRVSVEKSQIENTKNIGDVKRSLSNITKDYKNLTDQVKGIATVAKEQRMGLDTKSIAKLKSIYKRTAAFQNGDIETIRNSKHGELVDRVIENVQEKYPHMGEQEAFDHAIDLPNKSGETIKGSPEIKQLKDNQKILNNYLSRLTEKQRELAIDGPAVEHQAVLNAQEELSKVIEVPRQNLTVGEGKKKISRLESRVKGILGKATDEQIKELGLSTYQEMNKPETIKAATEYVLTKPEETMKVLSHEIEPPKGIPYNAIYVAAMNNPNVSTDYNLATKLASIASTAAGQNLSILTELNKDSPVKIMSDIIKFKEAEFKKRYNGQSIKEVTKKEVAKMEKTAKAVDKYDWNTFINEIDTC